MSDLPSTPDPVPSTLTSGKRPSAFWYWGSLAGLGLLAMVLIVSASFADPRENRWFPKCWLYEWTGLHCPGCGASRAVHALAKGDGISAIRFNPLLVLGGPVIGLLLVRRQVRMRKGLPTNPRFGRNVFWVIIAYVVLRNVPVPERGWLAPPQSTSPAAEENRSVRVLP